MTNPFRQHGVFSWSELLTTDADAAKQFYAQLFGWTMEDQPIADTIYTVLKAGDQQVGGLMAITPEMGQMPACWGAYVTVDDVDAAAELVETLGGQVKIPPTDIPGVGRFALIQDPQGAMLSIITYTTEAIT